MSKRIAVFGGSFNPPGLHHRALVEHLTGHFDEVVVVPCGPRPDKPTTNDVDPIHRAIMNDLAFRNLDRVRVELFDLEQSTFSRTNELQARFAPEGEVWHVVGADTISGGKNRASFIHKHWQDGETLWNTYNFAVVPRVGFEHDPADLPPHNEFIPFVAEGSSFSIREKAFRRESLGEHVPADVAAYIDRYRLYRGTVSGRTASWQAEPRVRIVHDERNPISVDLANKYSKFVSDDPNCILAIGGDGTMLQAIRKHWRLRLPFFGVNAGHLGFLMNSRDGVPDSLFPPEGIITYHLPLLYVEMVTASGETTSDLAFNDTWIERAASQAAWLEVKINGQVRIKKLVADGILMATAAGSTAYARSMGAPPLLAGTPALRLVGSNVMDPPGFKSALLSLDTTVEFTTLGGDKRPLNAYVDGIGQGHVTTLRARASRTAAVELGFCPWHDMAEKIALLQFPPQ
ncbi:MAG TPA: NAD(+)/NADH kinase [Blastocatellia bacterium]|nr:NAD(+)/NADH kinase [Blastocatellia bacterium]